MPLRAVPDVLAWIGRQGTRAVALSIFLGLALPPLAAFLKPAVTALVFLLLALAFVRVESENLWGHLRRPGRLIAATAWIMVGIPVATGALCLASGVSRSDLFPGLMLQAVAPPVMATPAFVALLGLDVGLALALVIGCTVITPVTAPLLVYAFAGDTMTMPVAALALWLFALLAGAAVIAALVRKLGGPAWVVRREGQINGANVIVLCAFATSLMDGVSARIISDPLLMFGLFAITFALVFALLPLTMLGFLTTGTSSAFVIAMSAAFRNMGLMLAATAGTASDITWIYFAIVQFPIYLMPHLLRPIARRIARR